MSDEKISPYFYAEYSLPPSGDLIMIRSKAAFSGIAGAVLFIITTIAGGFLHNGYDHISQFISELYAQGAPNAGLLKYGGYIPSGILIAVFAFSAIKELPRSGLTTAGFLIIGIFYGACTILASFFPCDAGCDSPDPSLSQLIHNLTGFLTYVTVPFALLILGISAGKWEGGEKLSYLGYFCGIVSVSFVYFLFSQKSSSNIGLIQRIIELSILVWIIACSVYLISQKSKKEI